MEEQDFVYTKEDDGTITTNGYSLKNILLENNVELSKSKKKSSATEQNGGFLQLDTLAVPFSLYIMQRSLIPNSNYFKEEKKIEIIEEGLYDKLLGLVSPLRKEGKKQTKKNKKRKHNLTRKTGRK